MDELGPPWKTDKPRREAYKLMDLAGVRKVRLYDARHACLSFTKRTYGHPDPESLRAGSEKLSELLG